MSAGERRYDDKKADITITRGALGALALAVVKAGRAEEVSGFLKRHMGDINADNPGADMALSSYEEAMNAVALHVKRLNPTKAADLKEGGGS